MSLHDAEDPLIDPEEPSPIKKHVDKLEKNYRLLEAVDDDDEEEKPSPLKLEKHDLRKELSYAASTLREDDSYVDIEWDIEETASSNKDKTAIKRLSSPTKFESCQSAKSAQQSSLVLDSHLSLAQPENLTCSSTTPLEVTSDSIVQESLQDNSAANDDESLHVNIMANDLLEVSDGSGKYSCVFHLLIFWGASRTKNIPRLSMLRKI